MTKQNLITLITQDNSLINASYTLDLIEKRLILLAIARSIKRKWRVKARNVNNLNENFKTGIREFKDTWK